MSVDLDAFAAEWIEAWNAHALERILNHYADDVVFESPGVQLLMGDPTGRVEGKPALRVYWRRALDRAPDLRFELRDVFAGANGCALLYWSEPRGVEVIETFAFDSDGLVVGSAAYRALRRS